MSERPRLRIAAVLAATGVAVAGCNALLDIGDIEFGDPQTTVGGAAGAGAGGAGGHAASGGTAGHGGGVAGGGQGGGVAGSGGTGGPAEDCGNGVDDNADTLVDCADPLCATSHCIAPGTPANWLGPVVVYVGPDTNLGCPPSWPTVVAEGGTDVTFAAPSCAGCTCGAPAGATCAAPVHSFWSAAGCSGNPPTATQTPAPGVCVPIAAAASLLESARAAAPVASGGSCGSGGGQPNNPAPTFSDHALVCAGSSLGAGCSGSDVCAPDPGPAFEPTVCVWKAGGGTCNQIAPYSSRLTIHQSIADNRGCSACGCGSPSGMGCTGVTTLYEGATNSTCLAPSVPMSDDGVWCADGTDFGSMLFQPGAPSGGSCLPSGGTGTGSVTGGNDVVLCCLVS
jgi:hypothetical protein